MKYWIGVVSKDHVAHGVTQGIMQLGHGKRAPLARLHKNDWIIYYSPVQTRNDKTPLQSFTALGQIADEVIYQEPMSDDFIPYRRKVHYKPVTDTPIRPLIEHLSFIRSKQSWGYAFRFGLIEISEPDFRIIRQQLLQKAP